MVTERERFPARKKFRKLTLEEQRAMIDRLMGNPEFAAALNEARDAKARGDWVRWSDAKKQNGGS